MRFGIDLSPGALAAKSGSRPYPTIAACSNMALQGQIKWHDNQPNLHAGMKLKLKETI
jgi:hypothetical protein